MKRTVVALLAVVWLLTGCSAGTETASSAEAPADAQQSADASTVQLTLEATPLPTEAPTSTPTPVPTPTPVTDEILATGVFDPFFDDALFIGDSITATFMSYCTGERRTNPEFLGTASFLAATSYNIKTALYDTPNKNYLTFRGMAVSITQGITLSDAKWVYLLLGVNDMAGRYVDENIEKYAQLIDLIQQKCPNVKLVVQSLTPVTQPFARARGIDIATWNSFNTPLEELCSEKGVYFLDIATPLQDADGYLPKHLSSDQEFHFSREGNDLWVRELRKFAMQQTDTGGAAYIPVWPTPTPEPTPVPESTETPVP